MPILPKPDDRDFAPVPQGNHIAVCYRVIDLGSQRDNFGGEEKLRHRILITWEIPDELMSDGRPFSISDFYTWSMSKKANLRHMLESWRGTGFTERDFEPGGFDIKNVIGIGCMLNVVHKTREDGSIRAEVSSVARLPKGVKAPPLTNERIYVWLSKEEFDLSMFRKLRDKMQAEISHTHEYKLATGQTAPEVTGASVAQEFIDEEIPF